MLRWYMTLVALLTVVLVGAIGCTRDSDDGSVPTDAPEPAATPKPTETPISTDTVDPAPTPTTVVIGHPFDPCGPSRLPPATDFHRNFLHWTGDGSYLVLNFNNTIRVLDVGNARQWNIANVDPDQYEFLYGFHADVSPDGARIVYSTCEYVRDKPVAVGFGGGIYKHTEGYEIVTVAIDDGDRKRLTKNNRFENFPVWSPDGAQIAMLANVYGRDNFSDHYGDDVRLVVTSEDGGRLKPIWPTEGVALYPPGWSFDSQYLSFLVNEGNSVSPVHVIYAVSTKDGNYEKSRIGRTTALPSWSPESVELAFAAMEDDKPVMYVASPDGADLRKIWSSGSDGPNQPISQVSWSPDGSELLIIAGGIYVLNLEGNGLRPLLTDYGTAQAAWSPDASRIAVYYPGKDLITISRNGTDLRVVAESGQFGLRALKPPMHEMPLDPPADCTGGTVVPDPDAHPGLVEDCETLLGVRDTLAGSSQLNWGTKTPITDWDGVLVEGNPIRVSVLWLRDRNLSGNIPLEIGSLTGLKRLGIGNNNLTGSIPSELSRLVNLEVLSLDSNYLGGTIPPELGEVSSLRVLNLGRNNLRGDIPHELGKLANLTELNLARNLLNGNVPSELSGMKRLETLGLGGNDLSGCIPVGLTDIWVERSGLERCETGDAIKKGGS